MASERFFVLPIGQSSFPDYPIYRPLHTTTPANSAALGFLGTYTGQSGRGVSQSRSGATAFGQSKRPQHCGTPSCVAACDHDDVRAAVYRSGFAATVQFPAEEHLPREIVASNAFDGFLVANGQEVRGGRSDNLA